MKTILHLLLTLLGLFFSVSLFSQTSVPDTVFEHYLETHNATGNVVAVGATNSMGDGTDGNGLVTTANISGVTNLNLNNISGNLNPTNMPITDLTGIEDFVALKVLWCYFNQLTVLDMSTNLNLEELKCSDNLLTSLNVSQNSNLLKLYCKGNQLSVLDVSNNTNLKELISGGNPFTSGLTINNNIQLQLLNCTNCQLSTLDVRQNVNLTSLNVHTNQLTALDIRKNISLTYLNVHTNQLTSLNIKNGGNNLIPTTNFWTTNNPNLTCIEVSDVAYATANWTNIDPQHVFSTSCSNTLTYVPDDNFENYLETHNTSGSVVTLGDVSSMGNGIANDNYVFTNRIDAVTILNVQSLGITDLTGIEDFIALTTLYCLNNNLTTLNVSQNTALITLSCRDNNLTNLDVSQNTALTRLFCLNNNLTTLNVKNNNNLNFTDFYTTGNPNLTCIEVDNTAYSTTNWTNIDSQHMFSASCTSSAQTYVPDNVLEAYLETHDVNGNVVALGASNSMGNGVANDDYVFTNRIDTVTNLDVHNTSGNINTGNNPILIMTGIEDFVALKNLNLNDNNVSVLDITQNTLLEDLRFTRNSIGTIDVSKNTVLKVLYADDNQLTGLDVTINTLLEILYCGKNQVSTLDITQNVNLHALACDNNLLTAIDITKNVLLQTFIADYNNIITIDASKNTVLTTLAAINNQLTTLNIKNGNNVNLAVLFIINNSSLTCIEADASTPTTGYAAWSGNIDAQHTFSATCSTAAITLIPDPNFEQALIGLAIDSDGVINGQVFTADINTITNLNINSSSILDLTGIEDFTALEELICINNSLTSIDVSNNTALKILKIQQNQLSTINTNSNSNLEVLFVTGNQLSTIDVTQNLQLKQLDCSSNQLTMLNVTNNVLLTYLGFASNQIFTIDVSQNSLLQEIQAHHNLLTSINTSFSANNLTQLLVHNNVLTSIDVSNNMALNRIDISNNLIAALDLSTNGVVTNLNLYNNKLTSLDIRNGNNTAITTFDARVNSGLTCVAVDDVNYFNSNFGQGSYKIDAQTSYNTDCSSVWIVAASAATTTALLAISGLDADNDGVITLAEAAAYTGTLDLSGQNLTDVAGLGAFTSITTLDISGNTITDLSPLTGLTITVISRGGGNTKEIARTASSLETLIVSGNKLLSINLDGLPDLKEIDISNNPDLVTVSVKNGNNAAITSFTSSNTPKLTCILVDDINASYLSSWTTTAISKFVADEADCRAKTLSINEAVLSKEITMYPNPVKDMLYLKVSNQLVLKKVKIVNLIGKVIIESTAHKISIKELSAGLYIVQIETDKGIVIKKMIKN